MKIAISGASGFIGRKLTDKFKELDYSVIPLSRFDFEQGEDCIINKISNCDIIINLAGAPIAKRWTKLYKNILYNSRISTTRLLVNAINKLEVKPKLFLSASAIGVYDSINIHDEVSGNFANNFLSEICKNWEDEAKKATIETVILRFSVVLDKNDGAFPKMYLPFKLGFGGVIGNGKQWFSWIYIDDLINAIIHIIKNEHRQTVYNLSTSKSMTNKDFTEVLSFKINKPAFFRVPEFVFKIIYGEGAVVITEGQKVFPQRLLNEGFVFKFDTIEKALDELI
jgi:uncharacterized protein (TIGR01777 family)